MTRAVLDVNVLVSAFPNPVGTPGAVVDLWRRREYELIVSKPMLDRLANAWTKPYFRRRYTSTQSADAILLLRTRATLAFPAPYIVGVADDEEDDLVLATAVAGNATHLVTGDRGLLTHDGYRGLTLLTPADFRLVLDPAQSDPHSDN